MILPILFAVFSANHSAPSGPKPIPSGELEAVGDEYSRNDPDVVTRPILLAEVSVNQSAPSGPAAMPEGWLDAVGMVNSVIVPPVVIRPILLQRNSFVYCFDRFHCL